MNDNVLPRNAACAPPAGLAVKDAQYRPPLGVSDIGVAYVELTSASDDAVVGVSSPQAKAVEIHATVTEGARTSMKRVDSLPLPAGKPVAFASGGLHLMVISPQPIKAGDATFPIEFQLQSGATKIVPFRIGTGSEHRN